jgi:hypothetical protein
MNKLKIVFLITVAIGGMYTGFADMAMVARVKTPVKHKIVQCTQSYDESGMVDDGEVTETCREVLI